MAKYNISHEGNGLIRVGFGDEVASNDEIIKEAQQKALAIVNELHGEVIRINGAASLPVAMMLCKTFSGVGKCVAGFDPKLQKYVVACSVNPAYKVGDLID